MANTRDEAVKLYSSGLNVIGLRADGSKSPLCKWKQYRYCRPSIDLVRAWFREGEKGIGIIGGQTSGHLEALDFDRHDAADPDTFPQFVDYLDDDLLRKLVIYRSPGGGWRCCWRFNPCFSGFRRVLAYHASGKAAVEQLGDCINVVPGGSDKTHPSRKPYVYVRGHLSETAELTLDERTRVFEACCSLDKSPPRPPKPTIKFNVSSGSTFWAWDDFNLNGSWDFLEELGWGRVGNNGWRRPGKHDGISATTDYHDGLFYLFSSSVGGLEQDKGYKRAALYTHLVHEGDFSKANQALIKQGWGRLGKERQLPKWFGK